MQTVRIKRDQLITILVRNRDEHRAQYIEAVKDFFKASKALLTKALENAPDNIDDSIVDNIIQGKQYRNLAVSLAAPVHNLRDYDRTIKMLNMSVDDTIELTAHEFEQYVEDNWNWKQSFIASNAAYKSFV